jgi:hypothetical protein
MGRTQFGKPQSKPAGSRRGLFLLAMPLKHLPTGRAELGAVLLQTLLNGTVIP